MESMSDYPRLTKEKAELQGQLQLLKKQLEEAQEEKRLLHAGREWWLLSSVYQESVPIQLKHEKHNQAYSVYNNAHLIIL